MTYSWRARLKGLLATLAMTAGLITATSAPASADSPPTCHYDGWSFNACLTIGYMGDGWWSVRVGFDRYMPKSYADEILACGSAMFADLWGDDSTDHRLGYIPLVAPYPVSGSNPAGLFAEFYNPYMRLDEDAGSDRDEVYAAVTYRDCHDGNWYTYHTGTIYGYFNF
jgi:hypothetical protein